MFIYQEYPITLDQSTPSGFIIHNLDIVGMQIKVIIIPAWPPFII